MSALPSTIKISIHVSESIGNVSAILVEAAITKAVLVLAHGAGAGMDHPFMEALSLALQSKSIGTVRYNFPYMEHGKKRPDPPAIAEKVVKTLIQECQSRYPALPLFVGGKSFGGRMSSRLLSKDCPLSVRGVVFFGFPLHPAGAPSTERAVHLSAIKIPMLFLQGTRDSLAEIELVENVVNNLPSASLRKMEGADHSFRVSKKQLVEVLATEASEWIDRIITK